MISNENDPELNGKYLGTISSDFIKISENLKEAAYQVRKRKFSEYPIFPISKEEQPIGQLFLSRKEKAIDWNYYITYLDEFIQRKLIKEDGIEQFKASYKDPDEFCCLFVVDEEFTKFLYIPYPNE
ncbi:hypothetical protein [Cyclobacterium amurskyense]|jgi:hypothetical protein|uniref:Uncharacterized protein n=1 Tax=Cyclobacterium amurskyense TaxID=320787 RepID=A0A0H4PCF6_9BACT|nr:hypothetical protein [Cyclobacterium amurskyense]AKP52126.1 hypothetical protein CA2015_2716 [Cyclobacterium amurskyense]|tara:strand:+ start:24867 stop:25244 length:378 start_codon:yes stop_codon:yes gene_type:complete